MNVSMRSVVSGRAAKPAALKTAITVLLFAAIGLDLVGRPIMAIQAQPANPPHLGYGIHYAPNTSTNPALVSALRMDWVKIYQTNDASAFPGKHILYRIDFKWPTDWNAFRIEAANRAHDLIGSPIEAIEVGNEPNLINEWNSTPNAWQYTQMLRVVYTEFKAVNPNLIIVSGGLAPTLTTPDHGAINDLDFANEMLDNGAGQWFDAFGYHPYGYDQPPEADPNRHELVFRRTERMRALLEQHGVFKQIWLTEFGWLRNPAEDGTTCSDNDPDFRGFAWLRVSGTTQADYLVRAFQYADVNWPWAGPTFVWNLNWSQTAVAACSHMRWFSVLHSDGTPTVAFQRLQQMTKHYSDYLPHIELHADSMTANVSLSCLHRVPLGSFSISNSGYPVPAPLTIRAANSADPPYAESPLTTVRVGDSVTIFTNPVGIKQPGQYTLYINVSALVGGRELSQTIQGYVVVSASDFNC